MKYAQSKNKTIDYLTSMEELLIRYQGYNLNILEQIVFYRFIESEIAKGKKFPKLEDLERAYQQQDLLKLKKWSQVFPTTQSVPEPVRRYFDEININRSVKIAQGIDSSFKQEQYICNGWCSLFK